MKKMLAMLLAVVMVLSMAACAPQGDPTTEATKPQAQATDPKPQQTTAAPETTEGDKPYAGELPLVKDGEEVTLTIGIPIHANTTSFEDNDFTRWLEEKTGVKLKFQTFSSDGTERLQQIAAMVSGGEKLPDILFGIGLGTTLSNEYGEDGFLLDIAPYWESCNYYWNQAADMIQGSEEVIQGYKDTMAAVASNPSTGAMYIFPTMQISNSVDNVGNIISINKAWLDVIGKENPTTVDELYEVLTLFKNTDCNGNGKADEIPSVFINANKCKLDQWVINAYVYMNTLYNFNATDGKIWVPYNTDEYRQALITLNKWYAEGLISPLSYSIKDHPEVIPLFTPADGVAITGIVGAHPTLTTETNNMVISEYVPANYLKAETELGGYASQNAPRIDTAINISADVEDPELAVKFVDFLVSFESMTHMRYGTEGVQWKKAEAGKLNSFGEQADYEWLDGWNNVYSEQNNVMWHNGQLGMAIFTRMTGVFNDDGSWSALRSKLNNQNALNYKNGRVPTELVFTLAYNAEESKVISEVEKSLKDYIEEARSLFITGHKDPNSDADWKEYLDNLEAEGLTEWIAAAQSAYTRQIGG